MTTEQPTFLAYASHPSLGEETVSGRIVFDRWRLRFESESATLEIPIPQLEIVVSGPEDGRIYFSDPKQPDWSIATFDQKILKQSALLQQSHTRNQIEAYATRTELKRRLVITLWFLGGFAVLAIIGSILTGMMVRSLVAKVPAEWEQELGDTLIDEVKTEVAFVSDPRLQAEVDHAVAPLLKVLPPSKLQYQFYLMEEQLPNAFSLPGGHVVITTGLLRLSSRPEELAGVVAHELAHVTQKHGFRKVISSAGPYLIVGLFFGSKSGLLGLIGGSSELLMRQGFSQEYEFEADAVGWQYLVAAHIDPRGLPEMLTKLRVEQARMHLEPGIRAFSSHPATEKRIHKLEAKWARLKDKSGFISLAQEQ